MGDLVRGFGQFSGPSAAVAAVQGPYWQPTASMRRFNGAARGKFANLGSMGETNLVLPTASMAGASGYLTVTVTSPPTAQVTWNSSQTPAVQVWVKDSTGAVKLFSAGNTAAGTASINWLSAGSTGVTFFLLPVDANGNVYAPVDAVMAPGVAGIYVSPNTPSSVIRQLQADNQGMQVSGLAPVMPPSTNTSTGGFFDFLDNLPGGKVPWLIGAAGLAVVMVKK